jgi:hypothetical protein
LPLSSGVGFFVTSRFWPQAADIVASSFHRIVTIVRHGTASIGVNMNDKFRVLPIPASIVAEVRNTMLSPQYGHPAYNELAASYGPCRSCLRTFLVGEERRILFTYNPFEGLDEYPSPGPVFVHADVCESFCGQDFPDSLRWLPLTLEAYGEDRWIVARARAAGYRVEEAIHSLFERSEVRYVHVRNAEEGCFIAHVARAHQQVFVPCGAAVPGAAHEDED